MGFFERLALPPDPEPEPDPRPKPAWVKPENVLPGSLAVDLMLAHTDNAAVAVTELRAYPTGFTFTLSAVLRHDDRSGLIFDLMNGPRARRDRVTISDEFLRLGVQFADGTTASNLGMRYPPLDEATPEPPVFITDSGHGGGQRYDMGYWVWPLPPPGLITFFCAWPAAGIPESSATIEAAAIHDAAGRAVVLWPDERNDP